MEKGRHDKAEMGLVLAVLNVLGVPLNTGEPPEPPTLAEPAARLVGHIADASVDLDAVIAMAMGD